MNEDKFVDAVIIIGILTVIGLKIANVITIPWLWLLSPIWIGLGLGIILTIILFTLYIIRRLWK